MLLWLDDVRNPVKFGYNCAICKRKPSNKPLSIDHNHACCPGGKTCGKCIRGLLCRRCNTVLGLVNDDASILLSALKYLEEK